jgi:hypothetical protein
MTADSTRIAPRKQMARSAVSTGKVVVEGVDGRSKAARRLHDIIEDLTSDLGGNLGEAEVQQVRLAAGLLLHNEQLAADMINGKAVDSEQLTRTANVASRLLTALKAKRQARKPAAPTLAEYLAAKAAREAEAAA